MKQNFFFVFNKLLELVADPSPEVKESATTLVWELQDMVQNAINRNHQFELDELLRII